MVVKRRISTQSDLKLYFWGQWVFGFLPTITLILILVKLKIGNIDRQYEDFALLIATISAPIFSLAGAYNRHHGYLTGLSRLLLAWTVLIGTLALIGFITKTSASFSRIIMVGWAFSSLLILSTSYILIHYLIKTYSNSLQKRCNTIIIGTNHNANKLARKISKKRNEPLIGMISVSEKNKNVTKLPILGEIDDIYKIIQEKNINRIYIVLPLQEAEIIHRIYINLLDLNIDIIWMPDFSQLILLNNSYSEIDGLPLFHLSESPLTSYPTAAMTKAVMDRMVAMLSILLCSPVLIAVAIAVKLSSPGPIIFKQKRHGWNGKVIEVWKFRSMRIHDDQQVKQATKGDPRITRVGAFIRRTSLDELPQLFNVLQGSMSLVGPRPHAIEHNDYYTGKINAYMARHRIKPGITGLAQISGCRGETETIEKMERRVELDITYINHWSLWLDIKILLKTPFTLFSKNIY